MSRKVADFKTLRSFFRSRSAFIHDVVVDSPGVSKRIGIITDAIKAKSEEAMRSKIGQKIKIAKEYAKLEMAPPTTNDIQKIQDDLKLILNFMKSQCYKDLTVKQAWLLLLVGLEVSLWFFLGETIGKMSFVGYKV